MEKFIELVAEDNNGGMRLYARLDNGNLVHLKDFSPFFEDYNLYPDETGAIYCVYSEYSVTYLLRDSRLFVITFDENGVPNETEFTLEMLLSRGESDESHETYEDLVS